MEVFRIDDEIILIFVKDEVVGRFLAINEDAVEPWGAYVAREVVFTIETFGENGIHKHIGCRVGLGRCDIAETVVHGPYFQTTGNVFLAFVEAVGFVAVGLCEVAVGIQRVIVLGSEIGAYPQKGNDKNPQSVGLHHDV